MKRVRGLSIENKILIPFVLISLVSVAGFCAVLYSTEYGVKLETETEIARSLDGYLQADINAGEFWKDPQALLEKYRSCYQGDSLFLYDSSGRLLFSRRTPGDAELVLADSSDNRLGWRMVYSLDQHALRSSFIEEQRYLILGVVALLIIIIQASVFIAYNISDPIRQLSRICTQVSTSPDRGEDLNAEYTRRRDEVGQLARAFQSMLDGIRGYIGELSRVKALNESIVENLPLGVVVCNDREEIVFTSARADAMLERTGERDSQGHTLRDILSVLVRRNDVLPEPVRLSTADGKVRDYEFGFWKLSRSGTLDWSNLFTIDDVTYKRHMEEKLSREEKLAYTGRLAATVAHEARNPLAGIRAGLQVVGRKLDTERDQMLCREMVREVDRVNSLIENLLHLARQQESTKSTVSLNALGEELQLLYSKVAENNGITLDMDLDQALWLFADEQQLRQILINLINNSIRALPGGGQIRICGRAGEEGVTVSVQDNGCGMDPDTCEKALSGAGGGLGLSIVQKLMKQNGGTMQLESEPGRGTAVTLTFHGTGGGPR